MQLHWVMVVRVVVDCVLTSFVKLRVRWDGVVQHVLSSMNYIDRSSNVGKVVNKIDVLVILVPSVRQFNL